LQPLFLLPAENWLLPTSPIGMAKVKKSSANTNFTLNQVLAEMWIVFLQTEKV